MSASTMATLMLAVFTVSVGFGVVLPLLPYLIERLLGAGVSATQVSRHTGLLTAVYTLSLFLLAPMCGRLSDRRGPRGVLLLGLLGFGVTNQVFSFVESLAAVYAERFLREQDSPSFFVKGIPDETSICRLHHLLEKHGLPDQKCQQGQGERLIDVAFSWTSHCEVANCPLW